MQAQPSLSLASVCVCLRLAGQDLVQDVAVACEGNPGICFAILRRFAKPGLMDIQVQLPVTRVQRSSLGKHCCGPRFLYPCQCPLHTSLPQAYMKPKTGSGQAPTNLSLALHSHTHPVLSCSGLLCLAVPWDPGSSEGRGGGGAPKCAPVRSPVGAMLSLMISGIFYHHQLFEEGEQKAEDVDSSLTHSPTHSLTHCISPSLYLYISQSLYLSISLSLYLSISRALALSSSRALALSLSRSLTLSPSHPLTLTPSHPLTLALSIFFAGACGGHLRRAKYFPFFFYSAKRPPRGDPGLGLSLVKSGPPVLERYLPPSLSISLSLSRSLAARSIPPSTTYHLSKASTSPLCTRTAERTLGCSDFFKPRPARPSPGPSSCLVLLPWIEGDERGKLSFFHICLPHI